MQPRQPHYETTRTNYATIPTSRTRKRTLTTMTTPEQIRGWIQAGLPDAEVRVDGDGHHFEAVIVAADFADKSLIGRHQMVYTALGDKMKSAIHALSMKTLTPEEHALAAEQSREQP